MRALAELVARLDPERLEEVLKQYERREIGLARGAELLDIHVMDFQAIAGEHGIELAFTTDALAEDVKTLKGLGHLRD